MYLRMQDRGSEIKARTDVDVLDESILEVENRNKISVEGAIGTIFVNVAPYTQCASTTPLRLSDWNQS